MNIREIAGNTLRNEGEAILGLIDNLTEDFEKTVKLIEGCSGKLVISGIGKSGIIGRKISATLASTGTPSFFLHPSEAYHGDLGMISENDIILAISKSGETDEILRIIPFFKGNGNVIVAMTGNPDSTLARNADFHLNIHVKKEACPLNLAPTSSTTATLAMGDALAVALMNVKHFKEKNFARFHPGGNLGKKLLTCVGEVMRRKNLPFIPEQSTIADLLLKMSEGKIGLAIVGDPEHLLGVISDGDIRRGLVKYQDLRKLNIEKLLSPDPVCVDYYDKLENVENLMKGKKITVVLVKKMHRLVGVYQIFH